MSNNTDYAEFLIGGIKEETKKALTAAARKAMGLATRVTVQDSGQAASNWMFALNNDGSRSEFVDTRGTSPVGNVGDKGRNSNAISFHKMAAIGSAIKAVPAKELTSVTIYHTLNLNSEYADPKHAYLERAAKIASNPNVLGDEVRAALRGR